MNELISDINFERGNVSRTRDPQKERTRARQGIASSVVVTPLATIDAITHGALTKSYNTHVFDIIPTEHITASRLVIAGVYAAVGAAGVYLNNKLNRPDELARVIQLSDYRLE